MNIVDYEPCKTGNLKGWVLKHIDAQNLLKSIHEHIKQYPPIYCGRRWRKVYKIETFQGMNLYAKIIDENFHEKRTFLNRFFSAEVTRYLRNYFRMLKCDIYTPKLLLALGEKKYGCWYCGILVTEELAGYIPLLDFLKGLPGQKVEKEIINGVVRDVAVLTAKMHNAGFYFSMDGGNILVKKDHRACIDKIALIDLDHIRKEFYGDLPRRRRKRSLLRFKRNVSDSAYKVFVQEYARCHLPSMNLLKSCLI